MMDNTCAIYFASQRKQPDLIIYRILHRGIFQKVQVHVPVDIKIKKEKLVENQRNVQHIKKIAKQSLVKKTRKNSYILFRFSNLNKKNYIKYEYVNF